MCSIYNCLNLKNRKKFKLKRYNKNTISFSKLEMVISEFNIMT